MNNLNQQCATLAHKVVCCSATTHLVSGISFHSRSRLVFRCFFATVAIIMTFLISFDIFFTFSRLVFHTRSMHAPGHTQKIFRLFLFIMSLYYFLFMSFLSASAQEISGATAECSLARKMFFFCHHAQLVGKNVCNILCMT